MDNKIAVGFHADKDREIDENCVSDAWLKKNLSEP